MNRDSFGVEPICKLLQVVPSGCHHHAARQRNPALRCRDDMLAPTIERVWQVNLEVWGTADLFSASL
jgi:hypothetical protein